MNNIELENLKNHEIIVFGFEHYNPLTQARTFGSIGIRPIGIFIKSKFKFASFSKWFKEVYYVNSIQEGYELIINNWSSRLNKPFIVTSDDEINTFIDGHFDEVIGSFYFNNCNRKYFLRQLMSKTTQLEIAKDCGFDIPAFITTDKLKMSSVRYPVIVKANDSLEPDWKKRSTVCHDEGELKSMLATNEGKVFVEEYIDRKDEIAVQGYSFDCGKKCITQLCLTRAYLVDGAPGKKFYCKKFSNDVLKKRISSMIEKIGFSGVFEAEFLVDKTDKIYFSEINFRNSGLGYATTVADASHLIGWCCACINDENHIPVEPKDDLNLVGMDEFADFRIRVLQQKTISFFKWKKEFKTSDFKFYYDKKDKKPFRKAIINKIFHSKH